MSELFIDDYRAIHLAAQHMLTSARRGEWQEVKMIATEISKSTQVMSAPDKANKLNADCRAERAQILMSLVSIDYEIRSLRDPQSQQLDLMLRG
jgi:hypothetical protein